MTKNVHPKIVGQSPMMKKAKKAEKNLNEMMNNDSVNKDYEGTLEV